MDKLEQLLATLEADLQRAFREAIADIVDNAILKEVIEALDRRDIEGAFRALGITPPVFNPLHQTLQSIVQQTGAIFSNMVPKYLTGADGIKTMFRFNVRDRRAEDWIRNKSSSLINGIEHDIRSSVQNTLQDGLGAGRNPRSVALDIVGRINPETGKREGGAVGLGQLEENWSRSARQKLLSLDPSYLELGLRDKRFDKLVQQSIEKGVPLPLATVDKLIDRYRSNALKYRGEKIARTEAHEAMMFSEWLSTKQALEAGNLPDDAAEKVWDARNDNKTRHSHAQMDGQRVQIGTPFISPVTGAKMMYPGDRSLGAGADDLIACRCRVIYKVDYFRGVK